MPKVVHSSYKLHDIKRERFTFAELVDLFTNEAHLFPGQRDHLKGLKTKKHVHGALVGDSRRFAAVYVLELKKLMGLDGYHRATSLERKLAHFLPGQAHVVDTYVVQTMAEANQVFEQFNSLVAAKKSTCWFTSGLREKGVLRSITSRQVWARGKATAVQHAAGMVGSAFTKAATMEVIDGICLVNSFALEPTRHEQAGTVGAYYAIAKHCPDKAMAEQFIRWVNQLVPFKGKGDRAALAVLTYHGTLQKLPKAGGATNHTAFQYGLYAFTEFAFALRRKRLALSPEDMNLAVFQSLMGRL